MNNPSTNEEEKAKKQMDFFEKARRGVLQHLNEQGGKLTLSQLHDFSMNKYLIQHQSFSRMMETFVGEDLVHYDDVTQETTITDKGKAFVA